jgi:hypothetical protein
MLMDTSYAFDITRRVQRASSIVVTDVTGAAIAR